MDVRIRNKSNLFPLKKNEINIKLSQKILIKKRKKLIFVLTNQLIQGLTIENILQKINY